jgi:hypothetical protein
MGDVSTEPTMEEILSSIKRVIEESEASSPVPRARRPMVRTAPPPPRADLDEEVLELNEPAPFPMSARGAEPEPEPEAADVTVPEPRAEAILSPSTAEASRGALEALSRLVVKPEIGGSDTLEGMVREMLRPMLREWLDAQLPGIVEAMVSKEIARISDRRL